MTDAQFDAILADIAAHGNVNRAVKEHGVPSGTFYGKIADDEARFGRYARAKTQGCYAVADETICLPDELSDNATSEQVQRCKLRVETRKWHLAKLLPKVYGEKMLVGSDPDNPIPPLVVIGGVPKPGSDGGTGNDQG